MNNRFSRTRLLVGDENFKKLENSSVIVFGLGGVGGYTVEALIRCGIKKIGIVDNDIINISNLNRQIYALNSTIGQYKTDVAKKRILDINPDVEILTYNMFFNEETKNKIDFSQFDYIIDAIDTISAKIMLVEIAKEKNIKIISSMGTANKFDPKSFIIDDIFKTSVCPVAKVMRHELKKRKIDKLKVLYSKETPKKPDLTNYFEETNSKVLSSISFVPSTAGLIIAGEVIKDLINN